MNAVLKSTALLLATLSTPMLSRGVAGEEHHNGRRVHNKGSANSQQNVPQSAPAGNSLQKQTAIPSSPPTAVTPNDAFRHQHHQAGPSQPTFSPKGPAIDFKHETPVRNPQRTNVPGVKSGNVLPGPGGNVIPSGPGIIARKPIVNLPANDPVVTGKGRGVMTVPSAAGNKPIDGAKKPLDFSKTPAAPPRKPIDLSRPIDHRNKGGKTIDPGFNVIRRPKLDLNNHNNDKVAAPANELPKPIGSGHHSKPPVKLADGHQLHMAQPGNALADRLKKGDFHRLVDSKFGKQVDLKKQFDLHQHGDLARRMELGEQLSLRGGWQKRLCGPIDPLYGRNCFSSWYCGPSFFPGYCWFPQWSPWVNWCWNFDCSPICDPRPIYCRPIYYDACLAWVGWDYPVWAPMPIVTCGTWVDVPTVVVDAGFDVQLLAVRFVDPGHPDQQLGPRYRVWLRNNSPVAIQQPFNVLAYASNDRNPAMGLPEIGLRIQGMEAGQIQSVDLRLPFEANVLARDAEGHKVPFQFLHVITDSHREVPEAFEENNGAVLARGDILPVDPAVFAADSEQLATGSVINVAGEGFGPEPGQVLVNVAGTELQAEIVGWYDLGVQVRLPGLALASTVPAELVVIRGDRAASNPLTVKLSTAGNVAQTTAFQSP